MRNVPTFIILFFVSQAGYRGFKQIPSKHILSGHFPKYFINVYSLVLKFYTQKLSFTYKIWCTFLLLVYTKVQKNVQSYIQKPFGINKDLDILDIYISTKNIVLLFYLVIHNYFCILVGMTQWIFMLKTDQTRVVLPCSWTPWTHLTYLSCWWGCLYQYCP